MDVDILEPTEEIQLSELKEDEVQDQEVTVDEVSAGEAPVCCKCCRCCCKWLCKCCCKFCPGLKCCYKCGCKKVPQNVVLAILGAAMIVASILGFSALGANEMLVFEADATANSTVGVDYVDFDFHSEMDLKITINLDSFYLRGEIRTWYGGQSRPNRTTATDRITFREAAREVCPLINGKQKKDKNSTANDTVSLISTSLEPVNESILTTFDAYATSALSSTPLANGKNKHSTCVLKSFNSMMETYIAVTSIACTLSLFCGIYLILLAYCKHRLCKRRPVAKGGNQHAIVRYCFTFCADFGVLLITLFVAICFVVGVFIWIFSLVVKDDLNSALESVTNYSTLGGDLVWHCDWNLFAPGASISPMVAACLISLTIFLCTLWDVLWATCCASYRCCIWWFICFCKCFGFCEDEKTVETFVLGGDDHMGVELVAMPLSEDTCIEPPNEDPENAGEHVEVERESLIVDHLDDDKKEEELGEDKSVVADIIEETIHEDTGVQKEEVIISQKSRVTLDALWNQEEEDGSTHSQSSA